MTAGGPVPPAPDGLEAFAALAAHQLGEAVALMRGAGSVLQDERARLGPAGNDALRALNAGGERAQRYVDDLLDIVRVAPAPSEPAASTDLEAALDTVAADLGAFIARSGVQLQREPLPHAPLSPRDAQRLFTHLLRSALSADAKRMLLGGSATADGVTLEMLDDGRPAAPDVDPFAPFAAPRGRGPLIGAGVSLPVCARIVARHGGDIAMVTRQDGATLVTIRLASPG
jgi:signal transduction histidine kinase